MGQITAIGPTRVNVLYPRAATRATANVNPTGDDNGLTYTAVTAGADGNAITVTYVDPAGNDQALAVSVTGNAISVSLATNGGGTITSTAAAVLAAVAAKAEAAALVTVAIMTTDAGVADDGSGVVTAMSATTLAGGAGASYTNNAGTVTYNAPEPVHTAAYRGVSVSADALASSEEVDIYIVIGSTVKALTNVSGTVQVLTASIPALFLEAGPTYVFSKDTTASDCGVYVDLQSR